MYNFYYFNSRRAILFSSICMWTMRKLRADLGRGCGCTVARMSSLPFPLDTALSQEPDLHFHHYRVLACLGAWVNEWIQICHFKWSPRDGPARVAQWIEIWHAKQRVASSIPRLGHLWAVYVCVVGQVPSSRRVRSNHTLLFLSFSFSFPSPLSKINKETNK